MMQISSSFRALLLQFSFRFPASTSRSRQRIGMRRTCLRMFIQFPLIFSVRIQLFVKEEAIDGMEEKWMEKIVLIKAAFIILIHNERFSVELYRFLWLVNSNEATS